MLLEIAIFDSYGAGFEYANPSGHRQNDLRCYYSHPRFRQQPGQYTDDTEMSIGIAELLVEGTKWTPINIANKFVEVFKRNGQRTGYAHRFYEFLCSVNDGSEFLERIIPDSEKSGAAMRAGCLGVIPDINKLLQMCEVQAKLTHNTPSGIAASQAAALMSHYFIYELGEKADLPAFLEKELGTGRMGKDFTTKWEGKVGTKGLDAVHAALTAIVACDSMSQLLKTCIDFTGDVDTIAAIAAGPASCSTEIEQDTPENLILTLENGKYGKDFILELDQKLLELIK